MKRAAPPKKRQLRLRLYVAGEAPNSVAAIRHLRVLLADYPSHVAELEIIDVLQHPEPGAREGVLVTPTMIKLAPLPERRIIGNLKDTEALISMLGLTESERG
ncbi:MAG TPA: circadian clock KaiB family protein [Polyangiales bacterium]